MLAPRGWPHRKLYCCPILGLASLASTRGGVVSAVLAVSAFLRAGSCSWCSFSALSAPVRALASALPYVFQCTHPLGLAYLAVPARFYFRPVPACQRPGCAVDAGTCQARSCSREEGVLVLLGEIRPRYAELWVTALTFGCARSRAISCRIVPPESTQ